MNQTCTYTLVNTEGIPDDGFYTEPMKRILWVYWVGLRIM